jgi:hypothetical protein
MPAVKNTILFCLFFLSVLFTGTVSAYTKNAIALENVPFFESPQPGLLAQGFIDKHDTCAVDSTAVDSTGVAWFRVRALHGPSAHKADGWVLAGSVRYISDIPADFASRDAAGDKDKKRRLEILKNHPQWPRRVIQTVRNGRICLDMSGEQVVASWGEPVEKRKSFMVGIGEYQTLFFKGVGTGTLTVTLQNDRVIGWTIDE